MSTTTVAGGAAAPTAPNATESIIASTIISAVSLAANGRLAGFNATVAGTIKTFDAEADAKLAQLKAALDAEETGNPYVQQAIAGVHSIAGAAGLYLPSEDAIFAAVKASVDGLLGSVESVPATT